MNKFDDPEREKRPEFSFVGELPGAGWEMIEINETIVLINPNHRPRIIQDGELRVVSLPNQIKFGAAHRR